MNKKQLLTLSSRAFIDQSYGPTVHYVELWNEFQKIFCDEFEVTGICFYLTDSEGRAIMPEFKHKAFKGSKNRILKNVLGDLKCAGWLVLNVSKFDIVYMRTEPYILFTYLILRLFGVKLVVESNSSVKQDVSSLGVSKLLVRFTEWQERQQVRYSSLSIAVSSGIATHLQSIGAKNIVTINNGVASKYFSLKQKQTTANEKIKVVYVGTYAGWSGVIHIVELAEKFPQIDFYLYGEGQYKEKVEKAVKTNNVHLLGYVEYKNLPEIYEQFDAGIVLYTMGRNDIVLSSIKTMEYMACGLPIFATRVPGQEYISDNKIGVTTDLEHMYDDFYDFLNNLSLYKQNVEEFRQGEGQKYKWAETARKTGLAIMSTFDQQK